MNTGEASDITTKCQCLNLGYLSTNSTESIMKKVVCALCFQISLKHGQSTVWAVSGVHIM